MSEHAVHPPLASDAPIVEARSARKTYRLGRVDVPVLRQASIAVHAGEWVAILGASGSGKSTLLHLLGGLDRDDDGGRSIMHRGQRLADMTLLQRNRYRNDVVGFVFQFYHLLPELNVVENVALPGLVRPSLRPLWQPALVAAGVGAVTGAAIAPLLAFGVGVPPPATITAGIAGGTVAAGATAAALTEFATAWFRVSRRHGDLIDQAKSLLVRFGLGHRLTHRPRELSGGERQRVAIARALINRPQILLADEPTGNLDHATGQEILELLRHEHRNGLTIAMVTHDPSIAAIADRQVQIQDGIVVAGPEPTT